MGRRQSGASRCMQALERREQRRAESGLNVALERLLRRHPLALPVILVAFGGGFLAPFLARPHHVGGLLLIIPAIVLTAGIVMLPFGISSVVRRRLHPVVLKCPKCALESAQLPRAFSVTRWHDSDYGFVVCSQCAADFTVPATARLI